MSGEYVRSNNIEEQEGVYVAFDTQVIDVDTCEPVPDLYIEIWRKYHNSTAATRSWLQKRKWLGALAEHG